MEIQRELFLSQKIGQTIETLREFWPDEGFYLAFSGGKDSQALYDLEARKPLTSQAFNVMME